MDGWMDDEQFLKHQCHILARDVNQSLLFVSVVITGHVTMPIQPMDSIDDLIQLRQIYPRLPKSQFKQVF